MGTVGETQYPGYDRYQSRSLPRAIEMRPLQPPKSIRSGWRLNSALLGWLQRSVKLGIHLNTRENRIADHARVDGIFYRLTRWFYVLAVLQ